MNLTPQEQIVLSYLLVGLSDKEIGQKMKIKYPTVRTYVDRCIIKLNARNRTHAAFKYLVMLSPELYLQTLKELQEVL